VVRTVVPQHLAPPCQGVVRLVAVHHHAVIPHVEAWEARVEFVGEVGRLVVEVTINGVNVGWRICSARGVALPNWHRVLESDGECEALKFAFLCFAAGLLDGGVDLHGLAVLTLLGAIRYDHLQHQV